MKKGKVRHVRIEPAKNGGHIVHTSREATGKDSFGEDDGPHAFGSLDEAMNHVRGVLGGEREPDPDDPNEAQENEKKSPRFARGAMGMSHSKKK